ncbi:uncharacterized protein LY89DRAFT_742674 [Mollisia scopiformis]|uniref:Uncharacterized protein n=1 Tax=Mollisia scopiformis TaxID=149040 RepID=A0A132B6N8_MOLSC|nr:uncharacterized protein LY89DRAFT_742674 [Mollisia scopiformis]KUJ07913.1 hypothetical protein LY89DRAFT_742674 [Mollisia scopiformis]
MSTNGANDAPAPASTQPDPTHSAYYWALIEELERVHDDNDASISAIVNHQRHDDDFVALLNANPRMKWCFDNQAAILKLHSSSTPTPVFRVWCDICRRYFKHCMFSKKERKGWGGSTSCRWCQADVGISTDNQQFEVDQHVHCNRGGKKECGTFPPQSLEVPPNRRTVNESRIGEIAAPEVQFTIKKKMSQKERKARERKQREDMGI